ncbi:hypothetical protein, partial [Roseateles sp. P5_E11]
LSKANGMIAQATVSDMIWGACRATGETPAQAPAVVDGTADAGDAAWTAAKRLSNKSAQDFVRGAQWAMQREASKTVTVRKPDARTRAKAKPPVQGSQP